MLKLLLEGDALIGFDALSPVARMPSSPRTQLATVVFAGGDGGGDGDSG